MHLSMVRADIGQMSVMWFAFDSSEFGSTRPSINYGLINPSVCPGVCVGGLHQVDLSARRSGGSGSLQGSWCGSKGHGASTTGLSLIVSVVRASIGPMSATWPATPSSVCGSTAITYGLNNLGGRVEGSTE